MLRLRELADRTPAHRERHLDLLRAVAIIAVVLGHWLAIVVVAHGGRLTGYSALAALTWAHPVTWLFQVMPVFFLVGGFANAASLASYRRTVGSGAAAGWLLERSARLVRPVTALLLVSSTTAGLARWLGSDPDLIGAAVWLATLPLWFLVAYLAMVALTPLTYALHRRAAAAIPLLAVVAVMLGDLGRFVTGSEAAAYGNFLFGWLAVHQTGFLWYSRRLPTRPSGALALLLGGLIVLVLLTTVGPYPVSLVSVPGAPVQNSSPPSLALLALATAQLGAALLTRRPCERWLRRSQPWRAVVAVNAVILTVFLWHMSAAVLATVALYAAGALPTAPVTSPQWLLWRVPWVLTLATVLAALVLLFGRIEWRATRRPRGHALTRRADTLSHPVALTALAIGGYAAVIAGLLWQAAAGQQDHGPFGLPTGALVVFLAGAAGLRLGRAATAAHRPG